MKADRIASSVSRRNCDDRSRARIVFAIASSDSGSRAGIHGGRTSHSLESARRESLRRRRLEVAAHPEPGSVREVARGLQLRDEGAGHERRATAKGTSRALASAATQQRRRAVGWRDLAQADRGRLVAARRVRLELELERARAVGAVAGRDAQRAAAGARAAERRLQRGPALDGRA